MGTRPGSKCDSYAATCMHCWVERHSTCAPHAASKMPTTPMPAPSSTTLFPNQRLPYATARCVSRQTSLKNASSQTLKHAFHIPSRYAANIKAPSQLTAATPNFLLLIDWGCIQDRMSLWHGSGGRQLSNLTKNMMCATYLLIENKSLAGGADKRNFVCSLNQPSVQMMECAVLQFTVNPTA